MMIRSVYAMRDLKGTFTPPFVDANDLAAIRNFAFAVNNNNDVMNFAPQDFQLFKIGEFDSEKGEIKPCTLVLLTDGVQVYGNKYEK